MSKRLSTLLALPLIALVAMLALAFPAPAHADDTDTKAMNVATDAMNEVYTYVYAQEDKPYDEAFYDGFVPVAKAAYRDFDKAYRETKDTTDTGEAAEAIQAVYLSTRDTKRALTAWQTAALDRDAEQFDKAWAQFDGATDDYVDAVDAYAAAYETELDTVTIIGLIGLGGMLIAVPAAAIVRSVRYKKLAEKTYTPADNKQLLTPVRRTVLLMTFTWGMYLLYWFWQTWKIVGRQEGQKHRALLRAIFYPFTSFSLFRRVHSLATEGHGDDKPTFDHKRLAIFTLALAVLSTPVGMIEQWALFAIGMFAVGYLQAWILLPIIEARNHIVETSKKPLLPLGKDAHVWAFIAFLLAMSFIALASMIAGL